VIIGAGAAGLAAARALAARSLRVVLVEARDRVGGRVWSRPAGRNATPAELGAEFIHGQAELTKRVLHEAGMAAVDTEGEGWWCSKDADLRSDDRDFAAVAGMIEGARALHDDESVDHYLRRFEQDKVTRKTAMEARAFVEGFDAADPAIASAHAIANEIRSGIDFAASRPLGGYGPMFEYLRDSCAAAGVQMSLSTIVRRIAWRRGAVAVDVNRSGKSHTIQGRSAILTLPVGVLRHDDDNIAIAFAPDLPEAKIKALQSLEMGQVVKVVLWFRSAFWERIRRGRFRNGAFFRCDGHPFPTYWTQVPVRSPLIVAWAGGPKAIALRGVAEADLIERALDGFGALFNERDLARREFEGAYMHDWGRDPFACGAYSYVAMGGGTARAVLSAPVLDTLFFAGEATSLDNQGGTVNGALETGERAAAETAAALGIGVSSPSHG